MTKTKTVVLVDYKGSESEFELLHAERILQDARKLRYTDTLIWSLPTESNYEFINNGLRKKSNRGKAEAEE